MMKQKTTGEGREKYNFRAEFGSTNWFSKNNLLKYCRITS